jgi:hypothetical protein
MRKALTFLMAFAVTAALSFGAYFSGPAKAQVPSSNPPYNVDLGSVLTNTLQVIATVFSPQQQNLDKTGVICTFNQTAVSGSPSTTFTIQNYDTASNTYYDVVTSGAFTTSVSPLSIMVVPGGQTSSLPTAVSAVFGGGLARYWRVKEVVGGSTGAATTGTIGCNNIK